MRKEIKSIDIAKLLAAIMIIALHTSPLTSISHIADKALIGLCRIGVPIFFTMSAYLFFLKEDNYGPRLKMYCLRIIKYWVVYSIFGIIILSPPFGINLLRTFLFDGFGVVWFFHGLIVAMCLFVLLLTLNGKGKLSWFVYAIPFILYICALAMNTYFSVLPAGVQKWLESWYYPVFVTARNGFFSGTLYMLIGYCIAKTTKTYTLKSSFIKLAISMAFFFTELFLTWNVTEKIHGRELFLTMPFLITAMMQFILATNEYCEKISPAVCYYCRKLSFALYGWQLLYIVIIPGTLNSLVRFIIITVLCLLTGCALIALSQSKNNAIRTITTYFI